MERVDSRHIATHLRDVRAVVNWVYGNEATADPTLLRDAGVPVMGVPVSNQRREAFWRGFRDSVKRRAMFLSPNVGHRGLERAMAEMAVLEMGYRYDGSDRSAVSGDDIRSVTAALVLMGPDLQINPTSRLNRLTRLAVMRGTVIPEVRTWILQSGQDLSSANWALHVYRTLDETIRLMEEVGIDSLEVTRYSAKTKTFAVLLVGAQQRIARAMGTFYGEHGVVAETVLERLVRDRQSAAPDTRLFHTRFLGDTGMYGTDPVFTQVYPNGAYETVQADLDEAKWAGKYTDSIQVILNVFALPLIITYGASTVAWAMFPGRKTFLEAIDTQIIVPAFPRRTGVVEVMRRIPNLTFTKEVRIRFHQKFTLVLDAANSMFTAVVAAKAWAPFRGARAEGSPGAHGTISPMLSVANSTRNGLVSAASTIERLGARVERGEVQEERAARSTEAAAALENLQAARRPVGPQTLVEQRQEEYRTALQHARGYVSRASTMGFAVSSIASGFRLAYEGGRFMYNVVYESRTTDQVIRDTRSLMSFSREDPTTAMTPGMLRQGAFQVLAVFGIQWQAEDAILTDVAVHVMDGGRFQRPQRDWKPVAIRAGKWATVLAPAAVSMYRGTMMDEVMFPNPEDVFYDPGLLMEWATTAMVPDINLATAVDIFAKHCEYVDLLHTPYCTMDALDELMGPGHEELKEEMVGFSREKMAEYRGMGGTELMRVINGLDPSLLGIRNEDPFWRLTEMMLEKGVRRDTVVVVLKAIVEVHGGGAIDWDPSILGTYITRLVMDPATRSESLLALRMILENPSALKEFQDSGLLVPGTDVDRAESTRLFRAALPEGWNPEFVPGEPFAERDARMRRLYPGGESKTSLRGGPQWVQETGVEHGWFVSTPLTETAAYKKGIEALGYPPYYHGMPDSELGRIAAAINATDAIRPRYESLSNKLTDTFVEQWYVEGHGDDKGMPTMSLWSTEFVVAWAMVFLTAMTPSFLVRDPMQERVSMGGGRGTRELAEVIPQWSAFERAVRNTYDAATVTGLPDWFPRSLVAAFPRFPMYPGGAEVIGTDFTAVVARGRDKMVWVRLNVHPVDADLRAKNIVCWQVSDDWFRVVYVQWTPTGYKLKRRGPGNTLVDGSAGHRWFNRNTMETATREEEGEIGEGKLYPVSWTFASAARMMVDRRADIGSPPTLSQPWTAMRRFVIGVWKEPPDLTYTWRVERMMRVFRGDEDRFPVQRRSWHAMNPVTYGYLTFVETEGSDERTSTDPVPVDRAFDASSDTPLVYAGMRARVLRAMKEQR